MVTLNGQALSKIFSRETGPFIITFVFIKNLTDSKQNTVIQTFVRRIPLYFTSTCCHLILTVMMMIMMMMKRIHSMKLITFNASLKLNKL